MTIEGISILEHMYVLSISEKKWMYIGILVSINAMFNYSTKKVKI